MISDCIVTNHDFNTKFSYFFLSGNTLGNDIDIAERLNNHFSSVFTNEDVSNIPTFDNRVFAHETSTTSITVDKIKKNIMGLKESKSQGPDELHPRVIKECVEEIAEPLTIIFRKSLDEGILPDVWKSVNVTAIFKAGKRSLAENYRPISITPICCRIMERIIRDEILLHLNTNKLISIHQHGFRKGYSCITQLLESIEDWSDSIDKGNDIDVIYLDFKAAFDKVPYKRLLKKLWGYGIRGCIFSWVENFLTNRKQRVVVNGEVSNWIPKIDTKLYSEIKNRSDETLLQDNIFESSNWTNNTQSPLSATHAVFANYQGAMT